MKMFNGDDIPWKSAADNKIEHALMDDDFQDPIEGSGYIYNMDYSETPEDARIKLENEFKSPGQFFQPSTIKACIIQMVFFIPSHDMIISVLIEFRFYNSGNVKNRSFEVLPIQIH